MAYLHSVAISGSGVVTSLVLSRVEYFRRAKEVCCGGNNDQSRGEKKYLMPSEEDDDVEVNVPSFDYSQR